jgi:DNA repair protein RecO (recombination protein O)
MQWTDSGIVLGTRRHGESSVILELMTVERGRHLGLVRGGRGKRLSAALQPGNTVRATWNARIEDQLGNYVVEAEEHRAAGLIGSAAALYALGYLGGLVRLLPERDPQTGLHAALDMIIGHLLDMRFAAPLIIRFEVEMLKALGFGLDLSSCAATGSRDDLTFVSPKSGRAVSRVGGQGYESRMFALPAFLARRGTATTLDDVANGFRMTGYFLDRHIFAPRGMEIPAQRAALAEAALRMFGPDDVSVVPAS